MALTESEKNELKKDILNSIKSESQSVDELAEVTSLDNIKSLPAMRGQEVVLAPVPQTGPLKPPMPLPVRPPPPPRRRRMPPQPWTAAWWVA